MAIHGTNPQEQTWIPYEQAKDCSQGFCSIYCPQWCYIIFPPPPPFAFVDEDSDPDSSSNSTPFSPLVIAIIGILASAFLLISYYTIISKYCGGFRRRSHSQDNRLHDDDDSGDVDDHELRHQDSTVWHVPPSNGLDQALIDKISVYKYKRNDGVVEGTDCSVCLGEFGEEESLRLLPKCSHAFHLQCIDTWLTSHSNCPLCRANIVPPSVVEESEGNEDNVMVEDGSMDREGSSNSEGNELHEGMKESLESRQEDEVRDVVIEIKEEECSDGDGDGGGDDCMCRERVSIGDILKMDMEEEFVMFNSRCSTSKSRGENSKGGCDKGKSLHCVMSSTRMKRSMSGGRLGFSRQGKARSLVLPI